MPFSHLGLDITGTSHGHALRFSLKNFPKGVAIDFDRLKAFMARRAPGRDDLSTQRREADEVVFTSGLENGITTGETITGEILNCDVRSQDYGVERTVPRPGHADFGQWVRLGRILPGGGKNSGRLTAPLCAAGALAREALRARAISVLATVQSIGGATRAREMEAQVIAAREAGDSVGGIIHGTITYPPIGLGGALFDGFESALSSALFAIPGVKAVSFGDAEGAATRRGSAFNDVFAVQGGDVITKTNRHGGILGGMTTGMPIAFDVVLKPTPTVYLEEESIDLKTMTSARLKMKGRHDPSIVRRAVPVVEAVAALVTLDAILADEAAFPRICLTLTGRTLQEDVEQFRREALFVDMVELRTDLLDDDSRARVASFPRLLRRATRRFLPILLTDRLVADGGKSTLGRAARIAFFEKALSAGGFDYVDFEDDFRVKTLARLAAQKGTRIVRSLHSFKGPVPNLAKKIRAMVAGTDEIAKVAFMPRNLRDVSCLFKTGAIPKDVPHVIVAMGPEGFATRALAARLGSLWTYTSSLAALAHVSPQALVRDFRFRSATKAATLFGVTGFPLKATRSPEIQNAAFQLEDLDAVMIPFPSRTAQEALAFMKAMGMRGLAVTIPHKKAILPLLDRVDASAKKVGAVNTVSLENGKYVGYNTDVAGFSKALVAFAGSVRAKRIAVLGDGGAAQAVKAALKSLGARFEVFHRRTPPKGFDVLVNATPVDPIPDYVFSGQELVYDLGYVPSVTPLMARAAAAGCRVENGFTMLVAQGACQREIWYNSLSSHPLARTKK